MARVNSRLEAARKAYREALDAARERPTPDAWAKLLTAGKELSAAQEPKKSGGRRSRRAVQEPTFEAHDLDDGVRLDAHLEGPQLESTLD